MTRVADVQMSGVGIHRAHLLPHLVGRVAEVDAVAKRLRHLLLAISAGQAACGKVLGQHDFRLNENGGVGLVEAANEFARHLDHRLLVLAHRHGRRLEKCDVGSLRNGIAEEAQRDVGLEVAHLDFSLHRRIALYAADGDEIHQIGGELGELGDMTLDEERALLGVETCCHPVESDVSDALTQFLGVICIVGEGLHIGHKHKHFVIAAGVLQFYAAAQRADVVAQVELSCGAISCKNYFHLRLNYV